ncbi:MAG: hypothetical protein MUF31_08700 [Akkermansiaceae bacterium]|jgi:hypothetical protein|nr:hypothetical protein [Akkermansiaceae bacterium]
MDSIPQISLGTAALVIFAACAGFVMLRGLTRMLIGTAVLAVSAWIGFEVWQKAPAISFDWFGKSIAPITVGLPLAAFLSTFFLIRKIAKIIASPYGQKASDETPSGSLPIRLGLRLLLALIPTSAIWFFGATFLRHAGSLAEIRNFVESPNLPDHTPFLAQIKESIDQALPKDWFTTIDPLTADSRLNLVKLIATADDPPPKAVAVLEESQIRDIILSDPQLRELALQGRYSEILRDPKLDRLLENDNLREVLAQADL